MHFTGFDLQCYCVAFLCDHFVQTVLNSTDTLVSSLCKMIGNSAKSVWLLNVYVCFDFVFNDW